MSGAKLCQWIWIKAIIEVEQIKLLTCPDMNNPTVTVGETCDSTEDDCFAREGRFHDCFLNF